MRNVVVMTVLALALLVPAVLWAEEKNPVVVMETSMGTLEIELYADKAPGTVKNFLAYVNDKFYDGTVFHRVMDGFMIQGGGFTPDLKDKKTKPPIKNEADNGVKNTTGAIAMARTPDPHSAASEFFINVADNDSLNHKSKTAAGWGYAAFGKVTGGMDVVNKIKGVKTGTKMGSMQGQEAEMENVPVVPVLIKSVRVKE